MGNSSWSYRDFHIFPFSFPILPENYILPDSDHIYEQVFKPQNYASLKLGLNRSAVKIRWDNSVAKNQNQFLWGCSQERDLLFSCCFASRAEPSHWLPSFYDSCTSQLPRGVTSRSRGATNRGGYDAELNQLKITISTTVYQVCKGMIHFISKSGKARNQPIIGPIPLWGVTTLLHFQPPCFLSSIVLQFETLNWVNLTLEGIFEWPEVDPVEQKF